MNCMHIAPIKNKDVKAHKVSICKYVYIKTNNNPVNIRLIPLFFVNKDKHCMHEALNKTHPSTERI